MRSCAATAPPTASGRSRSSCRPSSPSRAQTLRRSPRSTTWSRVISRTSRRVPGAAPLGAAPQLQEVVFADPPLANGRIGGPVLLGDDRLVIVKMLEHHAAEPKPLAQVHDAIVAAITRQDESQAALKAAQAARERLAAGTSFDAVLQDLKVTADPAHFVGRRDPSIAPQIREAVFAMPRPAAGKPEFRALALNDGGAAVVAVTALRTAPAADPKARLEAGLRGMPSAREPTTRLPTRMRCAARPTCARTPRPSSRAGRPAVA